MKKSPQGHIRIHKKASITGFYVKPMFPMSLCGKKQIKNSPHRHIEHIVRHIESIFKPVFTMILCNRKSKKSPQGYIRIHKKVSRTGFYVKPMFPMILCGKKQMKKSPHRHIGHIVRHIESTTDRI